MDKSEKGGKSVKPVQIGSSEQQTLTLQQALDLAVQHHSNGDLPEADRIYQQILQTNPSQPMALHLLGLIAHQVGENDRAIDLITKALAIKPNYAEAHCNLGLALQELGMSDEAVASYHKALAIEPDYAEARCNLGNAQKDLGNLDEAIASYRKALDIYPGFVEAYYNLGNAYLNLDQVNEAVANYQKALDIEPNHAKANNNLGGVLQRLGNLEEAVSSYHKAITIKPDFAEAHNNLGNVQKKMGKLDEAVASYQEALDINPGYAEAYSNLGNSLQDQGKLEEAVANYHKALALKSDLAEAHNNLGSALADLGKLNEAVASFRKVLAINPNYANAHYNLGTALLGLGRLDDAVIHYHKALAIKPDNAEAHGNLGLTLQALGQLNEALASYREALAIKPDYIPAGRNLLLGLSHLPGLSQEELFSAHLHFSETHTRNIPRPAEFTNEPTPDRRLRVGYMSSDFWNHPVGRNILPLLSSHDRDSFDVYCYAEVRRPDAVTDQLRSCVDRWHIITRMSDAEVAKMVRTDGIDVLICLAGHYDNNRPLVCAHRAAPVQVSYHDVPTSGLKEMDYFLTDNFLNPPDTKEMFTEELYRLPVCFQSPPIEKAPPVAAVPAEQTGMITFGSFNNPAKMNDEVIRLWAEVLRSVPGSRLLLKYKNWYDQASLRDGVLERFQAFGIGQDRIIFAAKLDTIMEHLGRYCEIDIALDPFPFNGVTTTFQALWMGVPVVSQAGETYISRTAGSILHHLGLGELVVETPEAYVACARELAGDLARLGTLRATLRERMTNSPLCDAPTYARNVEAAYRDMWRTWCKQPKIPHEGNRKR